MALKDIVDVQIVRQSAALTRVGFGTLAFVYDVGSAPASRVRSFADAAAVGASDLPAAGKAALTAAFSGDLRPTVVKAIYRIIGQEEDNENYVDVLNAAEAEDEDWYAVTIESRNASHIYSVAQWVEARNKIFIAATADAGVLDPDATTDIGSQLAAASFARTGLIYADSAASSWPDTAWAGPILPNDPGSVTWAFKRVGTVAGRRFTADEIQALEEKRVSRIENIQGLNRVIGGYTADAGAYFDIIRGIDWLKQRLAEDLYIRLVNSPKIPYTSAGIAMVEDVIRARLQNAVANNVIADDENLVIDMPTIAETSENDRANRLLPDCKFTCRLAGAIHKIIVRGTASV